MPSETMVELRLKAREEDRLMAGHNWVFSNELESVPKTQPGELALLHSSKGTVLGLGFYNPNSLIAFRLLTRRPENVNAAFLRGRLEEALHHRKKVVPGENSYRLCFGESDALPGLVVDKYSEFLVVQILSAGMERLQKEIVEALTGLLQPKGIFLKNDHPTRTLEGLPLETKTIHGELPEKIRIEEAGIKYLADIGAGQKTGFYFDQRENRALLAPHCRGRGVLDLYCYTGSFGLNAARFGANQVLGLDSSGPAVALARENAVLNGVEEKCQFDEGNAEEVLEAFAGERQPFKPDMILLDPPGLAPSKKNLPAALRAYTKLNATALRCLSRGGLLATSSCSHHVSREEFVKMIRAAAAKVGKSVRLLELRGQAKDHPILLAMPETEYLHFALLEVR